MPVHVRFDRRRNPAAAFDQFTANGEWVAGAVTVTASAIGGVPEPSTWALMLIGFGGVGWLGPGPGPPLERGCRKYLYFT